MMKASFPGILYLASHQLSGFHQELATHIKAYFFIHKRKKMHFLAKIHWRFWEDSILPLPTNAAFIQNCRIRPHSFDGIYRSNTVQKKKKKSQEPQATYQVLWIAGPRCWIWWLYNWLVRRWELPGATRVSYAACCDFPGLVLLWPWPL